MKVKVIKAKFYTYWYADKIGQVFDVRESAYNYVCIDTEHAFDKDDVEIIEDEKQMKKSDLKTGNRIKYRNGSIGIILADIGVIGMQRGFNILSHLTVDLEDADPYETQSNFPEWDVVEVYEGFQRNASILDFECTGNLLWKREEKTPEQKQLDKVMNQITELQKQASQLQELINK